MHSKQSASEAGHTKSGPHIRLVARIDSNLLGRQTSQTPRHRYVLISENLFSANVTDHGISVEIFSKNINHLNFKKG